MNRVIFSSNSVHWSTPREFYDTLNEEFKFDYDPCPLNCKDDNLHAAWGKSNFINPPYGLKVSDWINKAIDVSLRGNVCVMLIPSRTGTKWFQDLVLPLAKEIRFLRGRLKFGKSKNTAPFDSIIVIYKFD